jgi:Transcription factor S-II (TFIIS).
MDNHSTDSLDKFFDESPLFEEERRREQEELEALKKRKSAHKQAASNNSFRCKICHNRITNIRRVQLRRSDEESTVVYYCANCRKTLPLY